MSILPTVNEPELSIDMACQAHVLAPDDYLRQCNPDGTVKQLHTTRFNIKDHPNWGVTVDNRVIAILPMVLMVVIVGLVVLVRRRKRAKIRTRRKV